MLVKQFTNRPEDEIETNEGKTQNLNDNNKIAPISKTNINPEIFIKSKLSLGLVDEILTNKNLTNEEKEKYIGIKNEINKFNYYFIYDDINIHDSFLIKNVQDNIEELEKPITIKTIPTDLDYEFEFHKLGKRCEGLKERHGIIRNGCLFSSNEPKDKIKDFSKLKDKTQYLKGAEILKENKENCLTSGSKGEWKSKTKNYRIRINYFITPEKVNSKQSSFFIYVDNEQQLNEVYSILCYIRFCLKNKIMNADITNKLNKVNISLIKMKKFYTILKILSLKNKIKGRKGFFNQIQNSIDNNTKISVKLKQDFLQPKKEEEKIDNINEPSIVPEQTGTHILDHSNIKKSLDTVLKHGREKNEKFKKIIPNDDFMPLIANIFSRPKITRTLTNLKNKYASLQNLIPTEIVYEDNNESLKEGICFNINQGTKIEKDNATKIFNIDQNICQEAEFIYFNKNKPEIIFKKDNNNENNMSNINKEEEDKNVNIDVLSGENIHEISNVIYSKDNHLEIFGPKKSNKNRIEYKYKGKSYEDPEIFGIKSKIINEYNKEKISGIELKIFQSEIGEQKILSLFSDKTKNIPPDDVLQYLKDNLLFGFTIKLSNLKKIQSNYFPIQNYDNKIFFIEYNTHYYIPDEYAQNEIIIECYCINKESFNDIEIPNEKEDFMRQFLSPIKLGYVKLTQEDINSTNRFDYPIQNDDINLPNSLLIIDTRKERRKNINISYIEGKDYSIGGYSYLETSLSGEYFNKAKEDKSIPENLKNKYFNIDLDENNIYLRPSEEMLKDEFEKDITEQISNVEYQKIINNKKFNFLPCCEKYEDEETLFSSKNLQCLTEDQKKEIVKNYKRGDWIYKIPELKVKLLTQNIGVYEDHEENNEKKITQYIYCKDEEKDFGIEKITDDEYINEKIIPISENYFNIFDRDEYEDLSNTENSKDYQWKIEIPFKNELQMKSFLKLLILSRKNINENLRKINLDKKDYILEEILDFEQRRKGEDELDSLEDSINRIAQVDEEEDIISNRSKKRKRREGEVECVVNVEYIDFTQDIELKAEKPYIKFKLLKEPQRKDKNLYNFLEKRKFKNSLFKEKYIDKIEYKFNKKVKINKDNFDNKKRKIILGKDMESFLSCNFNYDFSKENDYSLLMNFCDNDKENYYSILDISTEGGVICNKDEFAIYKSKKGKKIYGYAGVNIYEKQFEKDVLQVFEKKNQNLLDNPYKIIGKENNMDYFIFGAYEPNVIRRKVLRKINRNGIELNCEKQDRLKEDNEKLNNILTKECIKDTPDKLKDPQINFDKDGYKKKISLKLLKNKKHEKFLEEYRKSEWELYYKKHNYGNKSDLKNLVKENLIKNQKETEKLYSLLLLGMTSKDQREMFYKIFLDINELCKKTKEKVGNSLTNNQNEFLQYFSKDIDKKTNIIFSLIDNDCSVLCTLPKSNLDNINSVKKIVKSFFVWAELKIGLDDKKDNYVYFLGILYVTFKLLNYFESENLTFLLLIGLSQKWCHFKQKNPLYNETIHYINIFGLVTKLIMEKFQKKIYEKFISLNFPIEFFISKHLSSFYADYFDDELMLIILDVIIFEAGIKGKYIDEIQYLRILCAIPITLFDLNKKYILECESVSELESILNSFVPHTINKNKFKNKLHKNLKDIYELTGCFEKYIMRDEKRKWDDKRGKLYRLINIFFRPVYLDNINYLSKIKARLNNTMIPGRSIYKDFTNYLNKDNSLKSFQEFNKCDIRIMLHISRLQQIYNNDNCDIKEFIFEISFDQEEPTFPTKELNINFDINNNKIINIQEIYYETEFMENHVSKHIFFKLKEKENKNVLATFSYNLSNCELMKITNIVLENSEENNKYLLELSLYKDTKKDFGINKFDLIQNVFNSPIYIHSNEIEEELYSLKISGYFFNKQINNLINYNNEKLNNFINISNYDNNKLEYFKNLNNINNIKKSDKIDIEQFINDEELKNIIKNWMDKSDISLEEIFYSIALLDDSSCINEKIYFLYLVAQRRDQFVFGNEKDRLSINKLKEMIYSLYKRFMVYFTKSDIDRMIDFLIKDERLFNIKYAFLYKREDENKIDDFIYDKNRCEPKIYKKQYFEIYFDNIDKQLNIYLNHLKNNYNITDVPKDILIYILKTIIENSEKIEEYIKQNLNQLTLVIETDNMLYKREFEIIYSPNGVSTVREIRIDIIENNNNENNNFEKMLNYKITNLDTNFGYNSDNFISFNKFKKIFFKLPYLSDLLRVNLVYNLQERDFENNEFNKEFGSFKVVINYENDLDQLDSNINDINILNPNFSRKNYFNFYYPSNQDINSDNNNINIDMNRKIKIDDTISFIIEEIIKKCNEDKNPRKEVTERCLKQIDQINCYIYYYEDENNEEEQKVEKIGYFDSLYSIPALKEKNKVELKIIFNSESFNLSRTNSIKLKTKGYYKIYYNNNKDFIWKKININSNNDSNKGEVKCFKNYKPILNNDKDFVLTYNI